MWGDALSLNSRQDHIEYEHALSVELSSMLGKRDVALPYSALAVVAVGADVTGRLLAPSLLAHASFFVVALSPSDPHIVLGAGSLYALAVVAFLSRSLRAWFVFRGYERLPDRVLKPPWSAMLAPEVPKRGVHALGLGSHLLPPDHGGRSLGGPSKDACEPFRAPHGHVESRRHGMGARRGPSAQRSTRLRPYDPQRPPDRIHNSRRRSLVAPIIVRARVTED